MRRVAAGVAAGIAGGAALVAVINILSRIVGFGRQLVFQSTVSETTLGAIYQSANLLPNVAFEIVAGGALASVVVPLLAGAAMRGDEQHVRAVTGALLGWTLALLIPVALVGVLLAGPVMELMLRGEGGSAGLEVGRRMLLIFLPQIPLYGLAVVAGGVLQAHRRFIWAALAPISSSVVAATAFLVFQATFAGDRNDLDTVTATDEWILAGGTTLGIVALAATTVVPMLVKVTHAMPTLRFPDGVARRVVKLGGAGLATLGAQQIAMVAAMVMANQEGPDGSFVTYVNSWLVYLLPYAALAVPIAIAAFPRLSEHAEDDRARYSAILARTTRAVLIVSAAGTAALIAVAWPVARFFATLSQADDVPTERMAWALIAFAPGLLGYGMVAHLGRALFARHRSRASAVATASGWLIAAGGGVLIATRVPAEEVVAGLGAAHAVGMTVAGILLVRAVLADSGRAALAGVPRTLAFALLGAAVGATAGLLIALSLPTASVIATVGVGLLAAVVAAGCVIASSWLGARDDLRNLIRG